MAVRAGVSLRSLAPLMGLSVASLFGYRSGSIPISRKAWSKLEQFEEAILKGRASAETATSVINLKDFSTGESEKFDSVIREDATPYRAVVKEIAKHSSGSDQESLLERIAVALEKLVEIEQRKNP